jgi:cytochrome c5
MSAWAQIVEAYAKLPPMEVQPAPKVPAGDKFCTGCSEVKPRTEFYKRGDKGQNVVSSRCKKCHSKQNSDRQKGAL